MSTESNLHKEVATALEYAGAGLAQLDATPFSPAGFQALKVEVGDYICDLVTESVKVSKRFRSDTVSPDHVRQASGLLVAGASKGFSRHMGTIGGILAGAGLSTLLALTTGANSPPTLLGLTLSVGVSLIGVFLVGYQVASG